MSLLDQMAGMLGGQDTKPGHYQSLLTWVNQQGGINGLLEKFREQGLGSIVESWVSSGVNLPVSASQVVSVIGGPAITALAEKLGLDTLATSSLIAEYLPKIVDGLSPNGELQGQDGLLTVGMSLLKGKLSS